MYKHATPDVLEQMAIQDELNHEFLSEVCHVERVVASWYTLLLAICKFTCSNTDKIPENPSGISYLVKWRGLSYSGCSWEIPEGLSTFWFL